MRGHGWAGDFENGRGRIEFVWNITCEYPLRASTERSMPTGLGGCDRGSCLALTRHLMSVAGRIMRALRRSGLQAAVMILLVATATQAPAQFRDVLVFAAASLKEALDEANAIFLFENGSGVRVSYAA